MFRGPRKGGEAYSKLRAEQRACRCVGGREDSQNPTTEPRSVVVRRVFNRCIASCRAFSLLERTCNAIIPRTTPRQTWDVSGITDQAWWCCYPSGSFDFTAVQKVDKTHKDQFTTVKERPRSPLSPAGAAAAAACLNNRSMTLWSLLQVRCCYCVTQCAYVREFE